MRRHAETLTIVVGTALATAAAVLAVCWTGPAVAKGERRPEIQWPVLRHAGCELTLKAQKPVYKKGEKPVAEVVVYNPTAAPVTVHVTVELLSQNLASLASRIALPLKPSWKQECEILVRAGERKLVTLPTHVALADGALTSFRLRAGKQMVSTKALGVLSPTVGRQFIGRRMPVVDVAPRLGRQG